MQILMRKWERLRWLAMAGLLTTALALSVLLQSLPGIAMSPDSVVYLSAAENLGAGLGLVDYTMRPLVIFPPGIPLAIMGLGLLPVDSGEAFVVLNMIAAAVLAFCAVELMRTACFKYTHAWLVTLALAVGTPLHWVFGWAWSEPLYLALLMLLMWFTVRILSVGALTPINLTVWVLAAGSLAATRYTAIPMIAVVACAIPLVWWSARNGQQGARRRLLRDAAVLLVGGMLLPFAILVRNFVVSGTVSGERLDSLTGPLDNLFMAASTLYGWLVPIPGLLPRALGSLVLLLAILLIVRGAKLRLDSDEVSAVSRVPVLMAGLGVFHWLFMIWSASTVSLDWLDNRLLAPTYLLLCIGAVPLIAEQIESVSRQASRILLPASLLVLLAWFGVTLQTTGAAVWEASREGRCISDVRSDMLKALRSEDYSGAVFFSNQPWTVFLHTELKPISESAHRVGYWPGEEHAKEHPLTSRKADTRMVLVWFYTDYLDRFLTPDEIDGLRLVERYEDGAVYELYP